MQGTLGEQASSALAMKCPALGAALADTISGGEVFSIENRIQRRLRGVDFNFS